jgi:hypothetical protein
MGTLKSKSTKKWSIWITENWHKNLLLKVWFIDSVVGKLSSCFVGYVDFLLLLFSSSEIRKMARKIQGHVLSQKFRNDDASNFVARSDFFLCRKNCLHQNRAKKLRFRSLIRNCITLLQWHMYICNYVTANFLHRCYHYSLMQ